MGCGLQPPRMQLFQVPPPFVRRQNKHKKKENLPLHSRYSKNKYYIAETSAARKVLVYKT